MVVQLGAVERGNLDAEKEKWAEKLDFGWRSWLSGWRVA